MAINIIPKAIAAEYKQDQDYKSSMGMLDDLPRYVDYYEGRQYKTTAKTDNIPKPIFNICDWIINNKQSNILAGELKLIFSAEELPDDVTKAEEINEKIDVFNSAVEKMWQDVGQENLKKTLSQHTLLLGTGILHYYWDNSITGGQYMKYVGGVCGESVNALDFAVANPKLEPCHIQKQAYIIIKNRKDVDELVELAKKSGGEWQKIQADRYDNDAKYTNDNNDLNKAYKCTTYTKYYKQNGAVYWTVVTKDAVVIKPRPLTPEGSKPFTLYPVEVLVYKDVLNSTYGRSFLADVVANQSILNAGMAMMLMSVQQTAYPKVLSKIQDLVITNTPSEIIYDNSQSQGDGVKYMQPPNFSNMPLELNNQLLDLTRTITGVTEVSNGEVLGANMSAQAIMSLQAQSQKPNEQYQQQLYRSIKNIGYIFEEFIKCYYNTKRNLQITDDEGSKYNTKYIGTDYADTKLQLEVSVIPKTTYDDSLRTSILEGLANRQWLTKLQYVKYAPKNSIPEELIDEFQKEEDEAKALQEQQQAMQEQQAQMQQQPQEQEQPTAQQPDIDSLLSGLSMEELQHLQQNPEILQQVMGGGQ